MYRIYLKLYDDAGRGEDRKHSIELSEYAAVESKAIKTCVATIVTVRHIYDFPVEGQFPLLKQESFIESEIEPVV